MAYAPDTVFTAQTTADTGDPFMITKSDLDSTLHIYGHSTGDTADIQISYDGGTNFQDYWKDGVQQQLSETNTSVRVAAIGIFRINKGITTGTVGVSLDLVSKMNTGG